MIQDESREGVTLKAFGAEVNVTGRDVIPILRFIAFCGAVGYVLYTFHVDHKEIAQTMKEMTYIVSLPQDARSNLRLDMPESLREKVIPTAAK